MAFLRRQVASYKGRIEHFKKLDLEGDGLYEEKIAECDALKSKLAEKTKTISGLESQVQTLSDKLHVCQKHCCELVDELAPLKANVEHYESLPWFLRMFKFRIR